MEIDLVDEFYTCTGLFNSELQKDLARRFSVSRFEQEVEELSSLMKKYDYTIARKVKN